MQDSYIEEPERDTNSSFTNRKKPKEKLVNRDWNSSVDVSRDDEACVEDSPYSQRYLVTMKQMFTCIDLF